MSILRSVLPITYPALRVMKSLRRTFTRTASPDLRVLLYHDVAPSAFDHFARQLRWLSQRWRFITPTEFEAIVDGRALPQQDSLLLTFDDGFASNLQVAQQILEPADIKALFFVASDFIDQSDTAAAHRFIHERLKVGSSPEALPAHWVNMSWNDLLKLRELGHTVGAHTASHERLTSRLPLNVMQHEIIAAADRMQEKLGAPVRHFAFPFGDFSSFSQEAMQVAAQRFDYIYSGLRGNNLPSPQRHALRRDSQTPGDSMQLLGAFLEGASDLRYRRLNKILDSWAESVRPRSVPPLKKVEQ
ncbi:polysaccharide deacetylase family protein [Herbaspirillum seropedicae]|uniref:polysaccharide deacetylase family protein n=1 Tax=Herbaspirillum seropedicae TaxID=964 RepID=UPI000847E250|nr:polysaccharide deacetylase family protein [Herbaspirillum seropedicae]AON56565.1 Polysaccharide deacetylase protein [Herbaspirillum seropedicae]MDR6395953.1 peptidoglycan/xylan/chitin deacetylase (PgdA/CDA1 family) [Herbaspirillum seropedicae]